MRSPKFTLTREDVNKWQTNTILFFAPVVTIYLSFVAANIHDNGGALSIEVFKINGFVAGAMGLYVLNTLLDLIKKYISEHK